jgi:23S rRNA (cytidine1920-2'-O)/16S rRNA (cytidine1409-2'-O)-methyltransferase
MTRLTLWPLPSVTYSARHSGPVLADKETTGRSSDARERRRLDEALVERGLVENRSRAQALIMAADILVNGLPVTRAGASVRSGDELSVKASPRFVSRGGDKLDHALTAFSIEVGSVIAADFGASTGGFTDCLLQRGAARVYAIDVGYGQLASRLRADPRVVVIERTNVRHLDSLPEPVDLVTIDVSFIGLSLVLPTARNLLTERGRIVALVKPQFEAGRANVGRGGVVRDPGVHRRVLEDHFTTAAELRLGITGLTASPLRGPAGNMEFLAALAPNVSSIPMNAAVERALAEAPPE